MRIDLSKDIYKLPFSASGDFASASMYPEKDRIILAKQARLNRYFGDKRKINAVSQHTNPNGHTFLFGRYGSRKNSTMVTIGLILGRRWIKLEK
jgi:hypothetical protein